jgi:hypothetical protein
MKHKLLFITFLACFSGWGQTANGTLDFGSPTNGITASTANTGFGGVRIGSGGGGFTIQNPGKTIGSQGELRGIAPTSGSINSVGLTSTEYGTATTTFTIAFDLHLSGGSSGTWYFFAGNGTSFAATQSNGFTGSQVFTGLRWVFGASDAITTNNRNVSTWDATGITGVPFTQNTDYRVIIIGNNSSTSVNYGSNVISSYKYDLWVNGVLVGEDLAKGQISNGTDINAFRFYGESSTSNVAQLAIDNVVWYNSAVDLSSTTYTTTWSNSAPTASIDAIIDGDLDTTTDLVCKDLTINSGKTLTIGAGKKLTVSGNLINNGTIIFKSDATGTAMFDVYNGSQSSLGVATVERYIPLGKRAFRLLSPAVTTTTFISGNWQEQTHITGGLGATGLGFDATETNNPSMYTYDNQAAQGVSGWTPIPNTNNTNLIAGVGYRVLIRGDKTPSNITSASANEMNAAITLSATGTLKTGTVALSSSSTPSINNTANTTTAGYSLVGNPYQSAVDWNAVTKSGIDATYWAWDPNMGTTAQRGRYVAFNGTTNDNVDSEVEQFIQPGQAFFVKNTTSGTAGSLTFEEADKATTSANVFRTANTPSLGVALYDPNELAIGGYPIDATKAVFSTDYSNELGLGDATKLEAAGENIAWFRNNTKLAIDAAAPVTTSDELAMKTMRLGANKNYTFKIETTNFDSDLTPYLVDNFLNTQTEITTSQAFLASFVTTSNQASYSEDRFKIVFQTSALSTDDFANNIKLYPNPAKAGASFYVNGITEATVSVYNVVGQNIPVTVMSQGNAIQVIPTAALSQGVYLVTVTTAGKTAQVKWIVE